MMKVLACCVVLLLSSCSGLGVDNRDEIQQMEVYKAQLATQREQMEALIAELKTKIETEAKAGNDVTELVSQFTMMLSGLQTIITSIDKVDGIKSELASEDGGVPTSLIETLMLVAATALGGGGIGAGLLQRFGRSRSAGTVASMQVDLAKLQATFDVLKNKLNPAPPVT